MRSARVEGPAVVFAFAVVLALAVARPFVCHSAAQRRNLLLVLSIAYFGQILHARYHGTDTWLWRNGRWQIVAGQLLRFYEDPSVGPIDTAHLDDFVGTYQLAPGVTLNVSRERAQLYPKRGDAPQTILQPESPDLFFRPGIEGRRLFHRNDSGKVDALIDRRNNEDLIWKKL